MQVADDIDVIAAAAECCGLDRLAVLGAGEPIDVDVELGVAGDARRSRRAGVARSATARRPGRPDRRRGDLPARLPPADDRGLLDRRRHRSRRRRAGNRRRRVAGPHRHSGGARQRQRRVPSVRRHRRRSAGRRPNAAGDGRRAARRRALAAPCRCSRRRPGRSTTTASSTRTSSSARTTARGDLDDASNSLRVGRHHGRRADGAVAIAGGAGAVDLGRDPRLRVGRQGRRLMADHGRST